MINYSFSTYVSVSVSVSDFEIPLHTPSIKQHLHKKLHIN